MGNMSIQKSYKPDGSRAIKTFTPSAGAGAEIRYQNNSSEQPSQSIFNFN